MGRSDKMLNIGLHLVTPFHYLRRDVFNIGGWSLHDVPEDAEP